MLDHWQDVIAKAQDTARGEPSPTADTTQDGSDDAVIALPSPHGRDADAIGADPFAVPA